MSLSDTAIKNARGRDKPFKLYDAGGLYLIVTPAGGRWWRFKYRMDGKEKLLSFGTYPDVGLKEARARREEARKLLAEGIDPAGHKKAVQAANRAREAIDTAHRALQSCGQIFRYAIATGRTERDVAADLRGALVPVKRKAFATITDPAAIGALLRDIDAYSAGPITRAALRLAPYVFVRPGELAGAEWKEFNLEAAEWRIPAHKMKKRELHIVPLSRQALEILEDLRLYSGHTRFLFPSNRGNSRPMTKEGILAALRHMGYDKDVMTTHGFRSMASTRLNEMGFRPDVIERQLAHAERNSVRAAYNHAEYLEERRAMMNAWADYLDSLRAQSGAASGSVAKP